MQRFYDRLEQEPAALVETLEGFLDQCYTDFRVFALNGAAYLGMGDLLGALESLEEHYCLTQIMVQLRLKLCGEVLYRQGQVVNAIELNTQLLARDDLPDDLSEAIASRQRRWQG